MKIACYFVLFLSLTGLSFPSIAQTNHPVVNAFQTLDHPDTPRYQIPLRPEVVNPAVVRWKPREGFAGRQIQIQLDSVIRYQLDSNQQRIPYQKLVYTLNAEELWMEEIQYTHDNGDWQAQSRSTWTYDQHGNLTLTLNESWDPADGWEPKSRIIRVYNSDHLVTKMTHEWHNGTDWEGTFGGRYTYFYDGELMTEYIFEGWDAQSGWEPQHRTTYAYNAMDLLETTLGFEYDNGTWDVNSKSAYTYNAQGHEIKLETFFMDNGWEPIQRFEHTLDAEGRDTLSIGYFYYNGNWDLDKRTRKTFEAGFEVSRRYDTWYAAISAWDPFYETTNEYNADGWRTLAQTASNWSGSEWNSIDRYEYEYDAAEQADTVLYPAERGMSGESKFYYFSTYNGGALTLNRVDTMYYSTPEGWIAGNAQLADDGTLAVFPNPASEVLNMGVPGCESMQYRIVDATGRSWIDARVSTGERIDVSGLDAGVYFLLLNEGAGLQTVKFIKE